MRTHNSSGMRKDSGVHRESFFNSSNVTGGRTRLQISCKLREPNTKDSTSGFASTGSPSLVCWRALPYVAVGCEFRTRCQYGAYVSISAKAEPTRLVSIVLN